LQQIVTIFDRNLKVSLYTVPCNVEISSCLFSLIVFVVVAKLEWTDRLLHCWFWDKNQ